MQTFQQVQSQSKKLQAHNSSQCFLLPVVEMFPFKYQAVNSLLKVNSSSDKGTLDKKAEDRESRMHALTANHLMLV